ncbi:response regulator rcp1 [mine drainage metagenome]|uniref:Response regulator rcp1 n=1 Tax=mine drainage metagenome TaxID=410659 RepID=A0A1J5SLS2_9ZZZZ
MNLNDVEILLVEDNDTDAELIKFSLEKNNMAKNLVRLKDGEDALEFIFATGKFEDARDITCPPKLILLDIGMPKVNGLEVLQRIKCMPLTRAIPVVILTSSKEDHDVQQCYNLGGNSYVVKPVNFKEFADTIKEIAYYWLFVNQAVSLEKVYLI